MKPFLFILSAALLSFHLEAQIVFEKSYGKPNLDEGFDVVEAADGGYLVAGTTHDSVDFDFYVAKTDAYGNMEWERTFGEAAYNEAVRSVQQTADGGYILAGDRAIMGEEDAQRIILLKINSAGNSEWTRTYIGTLVNNMVAADDGGYIIAGYQQRDSTNSLTFFLQKTNAQGDSLWRKGYGAFMVTYVQKTADGGYIAAGIKFGVGADMCLVKTDSNGDSTWTTTFYATGEQFATCLQQTADGGYIILGNDRDSIGYKATLMFKTDADGNYDWVKTFENSTVLFGQSIKQTVDGGYIIGGGGDWVSGPAGMIKTYSNGSQSWERTFDASSWTAYKALQTADGGYGLCGSINKNPPGGMANFDVYLVKTNGDGNVISGVQRPETYSTKVYPNPPDDFTIISIPDLKADANSIAVFVFDAIGKRMEAPLQINTAKNGVEIKIITASLLAGIYSYQVMNRNVLAGSGKLVVR